MLQAALSSLNPVPNVARELLWESIVQAVACLIHEAEKRVRLASHDRYADLDGWWRSKNVSIKKGLKIRVPSEEAISEALIDEIESLRQEIILGEHPQLSGLSYIADLQFAVEQPRKKKKGIGKFAKPTDIRIYRVGSESIDLRIEAKVLVKDAEITNAYLSDRGIKRFSDPTEPYTIHEIGGMLAYTVTESRSAWADKIGAAMAASVPPVESFKHQLDFTAQETLFSRVPYNCSNKQGRKETIVFHLVLEFDSDPPGR
ncbi:hypothetical protein [Ferrovibrio sp.]|uniref:hypothetical protein n=1 Tax=Ferrovibrio sp. TaxID=1917215 RepID=UPI001B5065B0|nr:hypothetical protein [Ferrovibrio sp.]MBP7065166.1 hypothetical protein [Ferrovibrio sp.]